MIQGHLLAVHAVGEKRLWMQRVRNVEAVPPLVEGKEENPLRLRLHTNGVQHIREAGASPLRNEGPALLTGLMRDLAVRRKAFEVGDRER